MGADRALKSERIVIDAIKALSAGSADALESFDAEVEWHPAREDPDPSPRYGRDGVRSFLAMWTEVLPDLEVTGAETRAQGDRVFVALDYRASGRESGARVSDRVHQVYTLRGEKIVRVQEFYDREEALANLRA